VVERRNPKAECRQFESDPLALSICPLNNCISVLKISVHKERKNGLFSGLMRSSLPVTKSSFKELVCPLSSVEYIVVGKRRSFQPPKSNQASSSMYIQMSDAFQPTQGRRAVMKLNVSGRIHHAFQPRAGGLSRAKLTS